MSSTDNKREAGFEAYLTQEHDAAVKNINDAIGAEEPAVATYWEGYRDAMSNALSYPVEGEMVGYAKCMMDRVDRLQKENESVREALRMLMNIVKDDHPTLDLSLYAALSSTQQDQNK